MEEMEEMKVISECRVCKSKYLNRFLSFGPMPLVNSFIHPEHLNLQEKYFPMDVCLCNTCGLVQLEQVVNPEIMFKNYPYLTSVASPLKVHFSKLAKKALAKFDIPRGSLIVDIGSNDGTLLENFKKLSMKVCGIEPASNIANIARSRGIDTVEDFFNKDLADSFSSKYGNAKLIFATNVFAHVDDINGFVQGVSILLDDDGIFIIEVPYLVDMINRVEFDTIYHEHLSYFAIRPLLALFKNFGMSIVDVERVSVHGGSLCVYVKKIHEFLSPNAIELVDLEEKEGLDKLASYEKFAEKVFKIKEDLILLLVKLKDNGAKIAGYGASAKGNTLLNFCKIGPELLDYIVDTTPFKQGCYTPGMHIPVVPEEHFHSFPPDYFLLLAWNYKDEILKKETRFRDNNGKFILPIPNPIVL